MPAICRPDLKQAFCFFCLTVLLLFTGMVKANDSYFYAHSKGWHWYDDPAMEEKEDEEGAASSPDEEMQAVRAAVRTALNRAILHPSVSNVREYVSLQEGLAKQATVFSDVWKKALLENPRLDYSITHPVNNIGRQIRKDETHNAEDRAIRRLAETSGLFFFYRSSCPYCRAFAPTVKQFSEMYGVRLVPITTDGVPLPEFPDSRKDTGQAARFHVTVEPALFAVNPQTHKAVPVGYGLMSLEDLRERILDIATHLSGETPE